MPPFIWVMIRHYTNPRLNYLYSINPNSIVWSALDGSNHGPSALRAYTVPIELYSLDTLKNFIIFLNAKMFLYIIT